MEFPSLPSHSTLASYSKPHGLPLNRLMSDYQRRADLDLVRLANDIKPCCTCIPWDQRNLARWLPSDSTCISMCSALTRQPSHWSSLCSVTETPGPDSRSSGLLGAGGLVGFPPGSAPNLHQKMHPKMMIIKLIQMIWPHCFRVKCTSRFPCSHSSQTSRNRFGSSVMTPSAPCLMLQRI